MEVTIRESRRGDVGTSCRGAPNTVCSAHIQYNDKCTVQKCWDTICCFIYDPRICYRGHAPSHPLTSDVSGMREAGRVPGEKPREQRVNTRVRFKREPKNYDTGTLTTVFVFFKAARI